MRGVPKLLGLVLFCWCVVVRAEANPTDAGRIVERSDYAVPRYDSTPALR